MFPFEDLCGKPVAAADYIALATKYHTLVLRGVPTFIGANRNEAYRFLTLVDVLYEHHIRLVVSAQDEPIDLFQHILTREQLRESQSSNVICYLPTAQDLCNSLLCMSLSRQRLEEKLPLWRSLGCRGTS